MPKSARPLEEEKTTRARPSPHGEDDNLSDLVPDPLIYHAVRVGRSVRSCVFLRWVDAETQVIDFEGAEYDSFDDVDDAVLFALFGPDCGREGAGGGGERKGESKSSAAAKKPAAVAARCKAEAGGGAEDSDNAPEEVPEDEGGDDDDYVDTDLVLHLGKDVEEEGSMKPRKTGGARRKATAKKATNAKLKKAASNAKAVRGRKRKKSPPPRGTYSEERSDDEGRSEDDNEEEGDGEASPSKKRSRTSTGYARAGRPHKDQTEPHARWVEMYERLRVIYDLKGTTDIKIFDEENADVRHWLVTQKRLIRQNLDKWSQKGKDPPAMLLEKVRRLEVLGVKLMNSDGGAVLGSQAMEKWLVMFDRLKAYKEEKGDFQIPPDDEDNADLRSWLNRMVSVVRCGRKPADDGSSGFVYFDPRNGRPSTKLEERVRLLEGIGFDVSTIVDSGYKGRRGIQPTKEWSDMLERLKIYKEKMGTIEIDSDDADNADLRKWLLRQESELRRSRTSEGKFVDLKSGNPSPRYEIKAQLLQELGYELPEGGGGDLQSRQDRKGRKGRPIATKPTQEWMDMYAKLKRHKEETGSVLIDGKDEERLPMRNWWYSNQAKLREQIKKIWDGGGDGSEGQKLPSPWEEKARLLEELDENVRGGPPKTHHPSRFDEMLERFQRYKADHGGKDVPSMSDDPEVADLARWTKRIRKEYDKLRTGEETVLLTARNMQRLSEAGFNFQHKNRPHVSWEERLEQLRQFKLENGHMFIPSRHPVLGEFVRAKRKEYNKFVEGNGVSKIFEKQLKDLFDLEFVFDTGRKCNAPHECKTWEERFNELVQFKAHHGHCLVPKSFPGLGQWVKQQRYHYTNLKKGKPSRMTPERVIQLTNVGFAWSASGKAYVQQN